MTVTFGCTSTPAGAPTPAGRVRGAASGRPVSARACATELTGVAFPAVQLSSPKGSCWWPAGGRPSVSWPEPMLAMVEMAWKSPWPTRTGATWVGA